MADVLFVHEHVTHLLLLTVPTTGSITPNIAEHCSNGKKQMATQYE